MSTFTTVASFLKNHYYLNASTIPDTTYPESVTYAKIPKDTGWGGSNGIFPLIYGHNQSVSPVFGTAQSNAGNLTGTAWSIPTTGNKKLYATAKFPTDVIRSMEGRDNAYFEHITTETDSALKSAARMCAMNIFRDGYMSIGQISALTVSNTVVTLADTDQARLFEVGMKICGAASRNSGALRSATSIAVTAVDLDAGKITFASDVTVLSWGVNDYLFVEGAFNGSTRMGICGFEFWIPFTRTGLGTTVFGVDRSVYPARLAGSYLDGSGGSIHSVIKSLMSTMSDRGGMPTMAIMNYANWSALEAELSSKVEYGDTSEAGVGFGSIKVRGPKGTIDVVADNLCQSNRVWLINPKSWKLLSLGKTLGFLDEDNVGPVLRVYNADQAELRIGGYQELVCINPIDNGVISTDGN